MTVQLQETAWQRVIWGVLSMILIGVAGAGVWFLLYGDTAAWRSARLPVYGTVPDFHLIERSGRPITRKDLAGKIWIADFIFTHCPGVCPLLTSRMARLQAALRDASEAKLVSFSVDPERDTPEALRRYAQRYGADSERWFFVTGELETMHRLIREGFRLSVAELPPEDPKTSGSSVLVHSDRFVLVDHRFRIRGYYRGSEEELCERILRDIETLRHEQK